MSNTKFVLNGNVVDALEIEDDSIIEVMGRKWMVVNDSVSYEDLYEDEDEDDNGIDIMFVLLSDDDLESLKKNNRLAELKMGDNAIWVRYNCGIVYVYEYYFYEEEDGDFNGYMPFESVDAAMKWCSEHTNEEIHQLLSQE